MTKIETKIYDARISDLTETEHNPRQISKTDFDKLKKSLKEFPEMLEIREVVIDENGVILGGHQRVRAAKANGESTITVKQVFGLTDKQKREFIIKDNIANGDWDLDEIANAWDDIPFDDWGADIKWDEPEREVVEDESPDVDESEPAKSVFGGVYQLGRHRLMCGDSTDAGSVAILMDGQKADMVFTDPPYGMKLDTDFSGMKSRLGTSFGERKLKGSNYDKIIGDNDDFEPKLVNTIFDNFAYCKEIFTWGADYYAELLPNKNDGSWVVWDKRLDDNSDKMYGSCFELCWSKNKHKREIARVKWAGLFGMEKDDTKTRVHPTQKPVALASWFLQKYSNDHDLVADVFGGSGSTLIACEQLDRKCYMMELDPKYCDVIRKRYWKFTTGSEEGWEDGTKAI